MLSHRIHDLAPSPTLALDAKVKQMQAAGKAVINLGLGEPDFNTPEGIKDAGIAAIRDNFSHYTATPGIPELRKAVARKLEAENGIPYSANDVVAGPGSKFLLFAAFQVLCDPGDEVVFATPTWSTYVEQIKLAQAKPVLIPLEPPFKLTAAELESHLTKRTKAILLNTPCNPTGAMIDPAELRKIAQLAVKHNLWIVSDEIYEKILYQGKHLSIASVSEAVRQRTITINGLSKAYAMTGWRVGYAAGPQEVIDGMGALQGQTTSNVCSIAQKAAVAALTSDQRAVELMCHQFAERRELVLKQLAEIPGLELTPPEGAFYVFVSLKNILKPSQSSAEWCQALLETENVAVVPGEAFLAPGFFRMSFAASSEQLLEGINGIQRFVEKTHTGSI